MSASAPPSRHLLTSLATLLIALPIAAETPPSDASINDVKSLERLEQRLTSMSQRMSADLDARIPPKVSLGPRDPIAAQTALQSRDRRIADRIDHRVDRDMNTLSDQIRADAYAKARRDPATAPVVVSEAEATRAMRMDSGSLDLQQATLSSARERSVSLRHRFAEPFDQAPTVAVGVRVLHLPQADRPQVALRILEVDAMGFDYEISAFGQPAASALKADWVAYLDADERLQAPASRP